MSEILATDHAAPRHIAIVGSGPSGCFTAQALHRKWPDAEVTVFDRLAVPYGLIRYGVAADHQHTKAITRQFDRSFADGGVRFAGNMEVGTDLGLDQLRQNYDIVVLASGRWRDRALSIPGGKLPGVVVSGDIVNALNAVPRPAIPMPRIGRRVVVVGAGNVALDMVRFLIKTDADYDGSDVASAALRQYLEAPATEITVLSRSPIAAAKADVAMVKELGKIDGVKFSYANTSPATDDNALGRKREEAFGQLAAIEIDDPRVRVHFIFGAEPGRIRGTDHVEALHLQAAPAGEPSVLECDTVISAIGFDVNAPGQWHYAQHLDFTPADATGRIEDGLYRVGWLKRGPHGAIPANRADANEVVKEIIADVEACRFHAHEEARGYEGLPERARANAVSFDDWRHIDEAEVRAAEPGRIRHKITDHDTMLATVRAATSK